MTDRLWCESAVVDGRPRRGVAIDIEQGRIVGVTPDAEPGSARRLTGLTTPGLANAHSHAFHRALRARTQRGRGTFWTWRDVMFEAAERLRPDRYHRLARAVYAEMALAGITCVGEFHYLHHDRHGVPYADPNVMGEALLAAADDVGIRITLIDTLYLHGGLDAHGYREPSGPQLRFCDDTVDAWCDRVDRLADGATQRTAAAIHSVRAVDPEAMRHLGRWASSRGVPVHAHISEQVAENDACIAAHGVTPTRLVAEAGVLDDRFVAVHATHPSDTDIDLLAAAGGSIVMCPTTERDLGDGIGPTSEFARAGVRLALGSDSNAVIDLFEEARTLELHERLRSRSRGIHDAASLLRATTVDGHRTLGWHDAGEIAVGRHADLVTVDVGSVRTAGTPFDLGIEMLVFAAGAADVTDVHVGGRPVVVDRQHTTIDAAAELDTTIKALLDDV